MMLNEKALSSPVSELVERFSFTVTNDWSKCGETTVIRKSDPRGDYVRYSDCTALEADNARLRGALEFYADTSKYPAPFTGGFGELYYDCGQIARAALSTAPHGGDHD